MSQLDFENIYLNQSRVPGRFRFAEHGLGWRPSDKARGGSAKVIETFVLGSEEVIGAQWSRAAKGYELRFQTKNRGLAAFDGFDSDDFNSLKNALKHRFDVNLESKEHSVRGWNWGKAELERSELLFSVSNRPAFGVPYSEISNSNFVGKNEVSVEMNIQSAGERVKAGDELVEMRFYIPGTVLKGEEGKEEEDGNEVDIESGTEGEGESAAGVFYQTLKEKADIGVVAGEAIVSFSDIFFVTPRGRYDVDMYPTSLRLRGKTYDYKIQYKNIQRLFLLPKPDQIHNVFVIQVDPPLRQGQTRYPFLVMQFLREEEMEVELNVEDDEYEEKYKDKLKKKYDEAAHQVVGQLFKGLTDRKCITPGSYTSVQDQAGVSCSMKTSEGHLYALDKCFLFLPKPTVYIPISEISSITFSRVGGSVSSSRTFDMTITLRNNGGEHQFSNISREEQKNLDNFIKSKSIKVRNDIAEEQNRLAMAMVLENESDDSDVEMDVVDRGSADEDEESVDEDYQEEDLSDVAEEYDSDAGSDSDEEEEGYSEGDAPAKKKAKN